MKRVMWCGILSLSLLVGSFLPQAFAEEGTWGVGLKSWYATWDMSEGKGSPSAYMIGPRFYLNVNQDWRLEGELLFGDFSEDGQDYNRIDANIGLSHRLNDPASVYSVSAYIGWRYQNYDEAKQLANTLVYGPALGLSASTYLGWGTNWRVYGLGYWMPLLWVELDTTFDDPSEGSGYVVEAGLQYVFESPWSIGLGYRYQEFDASGGTIDVDETFKGPTFTVTYLF